jgi:hypothetical protein
LVLAKPAFAAPELSYSRGLGDHQNSLHVYMAFRKGDTDPGIVATTFEQALDLLRQLSSVSNGTHIVQYGYGWEKGAALGCPYFEEDPRPPFDHGFRRFRELTRAAARFNANLGTYLDSWIAGPTSTAAVPVSHRSFDSHGAWRTSLEQNDNAYLGISLVNAIRDQSPTGEWAMLRSNVKHFGMGIAVFEDAMGQFGPQPDYDIKNECATCGGVVTDDAMERAAGVEEVDHLWSTYGISTITEFTYPVWIDRLAGDRGSVGRVATFWGADAQSDTLSRAQDYLQTWGNSTVFMHRRGLDPAIGLAWGSENGADYLVLAAPGTANKQTTDELRRSFFKNGVQYLYMQRFQPVSFTETDAALQVTFRGDKSTLTSTAYKQGGEYVLTERGDRVVVLAAQGDRLVPQVGAGLKMFAYTTNGSRRLWTLPAAWDGVSFVDRYELSLFSAPSYVDTLAIRPNHELFLEMPWPDKSYVLVPSGDPVTPKTVGFTTLTPGQALPKTFEGLTPISGSPRLLVQAPGAAGGFASNSVAFDTPARRAQARFSLPKTAIFHGMRIGVRAGSGTLTLSSSNARNPSVRVALPPATQTALVETSWRYPETGACTVELENDEKVSNVLLNYWTYSAHAVVLSAAEAQDGAVVLRFGGSHQAHYRVNYGSAPGAYSATISGARSSPVTVSGLKRGVRYYFSVRGDTADLPGQSNELAAVPADHSTVRAEDFFSNGQLVSDQYGGIDWGHATPAWRSRAPFGGLTSRCLYLDTTRAQARAELTLQAAQVLKSVRLGKSVPEGNESGQPDATITLHSTLRGNPDQTITLTAANRGQVFQTGWSVGSASPSLVMLSVEYAPGVDQVVFDDFVYGAATEQAVKGSRPRKR